MDYLDVKALSEIIDGYVEILHDIDTARSLIGRCGDGDIERELGELARRLQDGRKRAQVRYDAAYESCMKEISNSGRLYAA